MASKRTYELTAATAALDLRIPVDISTFTETQYLTVDALLAFVRTQLGALALADQVTTEMLQEKVPFLLFRTIDGVVAAGTTRLIDAAPRDMLIRRVYRRIESGTSIALNFQINGTSMTGLSALSATTTVPDWTAAPSDGTAILPAGGGLSVVRSSATGSPTNLHIGVEALI